MRVRLLAAGLLVAALLSWHLAGRTTDLGVASLPAAEPAAAAGDTLLVEPDDGIGEVEALLRSPRHQLDLTIYELDDPTAEATLADDAARGVQVRVILDGRLERTHNAAAFAYLRGRGVDVRWSSPDFFATHEKAFVIDRTTTVIMSLNLTSRYYATTRDAVVVDRDPRDAAAVEAVFDADFAGRPAGTPAADDLVWSPGQSQADFVRLIESARTSIAVESEELSSEPVVDALLDAAGRGVRVQLAMTYQPRWAANLRRLAAAGADVAVMYGENPLYLHAKLLVVDAGTQRARGFVGSENIADASLLHDRELGVVLLRPDLVNRLATVVARDINDAHTYPAGR
ncbi:MAG TPA: phospholipase D-like domain-containing protein [Mycobacteriales bacterium]|nr:phospholipase D-like domain-containing protein [Mycobacteriales bacterium]